MTLRTERPLPEFDSIADFHEWFHAQRDRTRMTTRRVPLDRLDNWSVEPTTGNIRHSSGRFFSVEGIRVHDPAGPVHHWDQPIINQPEVGILGILVDRRPDVDRYLLQAKCEPGNPGGLQLSPTVQATRSNYLRVHRGAHVPYLEYFRDVNPGDVLSDVRQSEQGAWFYRKRNRNMLVSVDHEPEFREGFCWLTLDQVHQLLEEPNTINMDARTVLACIPPGSPGESVAETGSLSWITEQRTESALDTRLIDLADAERWSLDDGAIAHDTGGYFSIIGVEVRAMGREVRSWHQPMLAPSGIGLVGVLISIGLAGVRVLLRARVEPGCTDGIELGPTVQYLPDTLDRNPDRPAPPLIGEFADPSPDRLLYDVEQSEEGGRFHDARNRYMIVSLADELPAPPGFRWFGLDELSDFVRHSFYLNIQARSLLLCLHSLLTSIR